MVLCRAHWEAGYMSEPKEIGNVYCRDNLKSALRNSHGILIPLTQARGKGVILNPTLDLPSTSPMCIESQLACLKERVDNLILPIWQRRKLKSMAWIGPSDNWQFQFRDCSAIWSTAIWKENWCQPGISSSINTMTFWLLRFWCSRIPSNNNYWQNISNLQSCWHLYAM